MGIRLIHGFVHEKQRAKPEWGSITVIETALIEMDSPEDDMVTILNNLPAAPNTVTATNPLGISFTFDSSTHPKSNALILRRAGEVKQVENSAVFWEVELEYGVHNFAQMIGLQGFGLENNPRRRKDQREYQNPIDRPVVWNSSTQLVTKETYLKADPADPDVPEPIVHANNLPISEPITYEELHETHNFSYNIDESKFSYDRFKPYIGKVASAGCLGRPKETMKFVSFTVSEEFESSGEGVEKVDYHFYRVTISIEYNPSTWTADARIVSMSTLQFLEDRYERIKISETEYAEEPWPLNEFGAAIPYSNVNPLDFAYIDHGYPKLANLDQITDLDADDGLKQLAIP